MTDTKLEIYYKRDKALEREIKVLDTWKTSARNKELIRNFRNYLLSTSSKQLRVAKLSSQLRRICMKLDKVASVSDLDEGYSN